MRNGCSHITIGAKACYFLSYVLMSAETISNHRWFTICLSYLFDFDRNVKVIEASIILDFEVDILLKVFWKVKFSILTVANPVVYFPLRLGSILSAYNIFILDILGLLFIYDMDFGASLPVWIVLLIRFHHAGVHYVPLTHWSNATDNIAWLPVVCLSIL